MVCCLAVPPVAAQKKVPQKPPPAKQQEQAPEEEKEGTAQRRAEWFYKQRAFPLPNIPAGIRLQGLRELDDMLVREGKLKRNPDGSVAATAAAVAAGPTWQAIGPQPTNSGGSNGSVSGRVTALAVDPTNANIVYLGGAFGGVWKTMDGGTNWMPLTDGQPSIATGSIAIDPSSCSPGPCTTIYVGTGEEDFAIDSYYGAGVLKSIDGGNTWTQLGQGPPPGTPFVGPFSGGFSFSPGGGARIGALAVHPSNAQILLAGVQIFVTTGGGATSGIYRSTDGGNNWTQVLPGAAGNQVLFDATNGNIAYAALGTIRGDVDNGVYKSTDAGANWMRLTGLNAVASQARQGRIALALATSNTSILYSSIADAGASSPSDPLLGIFRSMDGGTTWSSLAGAPDFCNPQCWYDMALAVNPTDPNIVYAGGAANSNFFMRSTNGGTSWSPLQTGSNGVRLHVDQHAIALAKDGNKLYVGNDGGAYSTDTPAAASVAWTNLNATLNTMQFYPGLSIHPSSNQVSFGGTQDNGTQMYSGTLTWQEVTCGDGGWTAIDLLTPSTVYAACQYTPPNTNLTVVRKSVQDGSALTFAAAESGINKSDRGAFIPPLVIDANTPQRLYFGTFRVWQTLNGASNWTAVSSDLTNGGNLSTLAVAPSNSQVVYAGTDDGRLWVCTTAGTAASGCWQSINTGLPARSVAQVTVDRGDPNTAYAGFSGFSGFGGDTQGHIFKTSNAGVAWTDISGNLPNTPVNDIVVDPDIANTLYIATDIGVFMTSNANAGAGTTWTAVNPASPGVAGLPRVAVLSLKLHEPSRTLRAATHGRGMWDLQLAAAAPSFTLSANPISSSVTVGQPASYTITVTAQGGFSGTVGFSVAGLPAGAGSSFSPTTVSGSGATTMTITTSAATPPNTYTLIVTGTSGGLQAQTQVSLTANAPPADFSVSATPPSQTITAGAPASYTITVAAVNGTFSNAVTLSFSGCPTKSTCSFSPTSVTPGSGSVTSTFTVATTATGAVPFEPQGRRVPPLLLPVATLILLCLFVAVARRRRLKLATSVGVFLVVSLLSLKLAGCGGSSGGGGGGGGGTPRTTYTITVTGTSGATVHSVNVTLTVQ